MNADPDPAFYSLCGFGFRSREPNQFGSMRIRIRILARLLSHKKLNFYMKNILKTKVGNR